MIGRDFLFNNTWLSEYGMKMFDPQNDQQFVSREIERSEITALRQVPNHFSVHYSNVLTLDFLIIKNDEEYDTKEELRLLGEDINLIRAWLESPKTPTKLVMPLDSDEMTTNYYGVFTSVEPFIVNQDCFGLYLTFTCNAPYGFSDEFKSVYKINASNAEITGRFINMSAEYNDYIKPIISVKSLNVFDENESIEIRNISDNNKMVITLPQGTSEVIIDCDKKTITDGSGNLLTMNDIGLTLPDSDEYSFVSAEKYVFYWLKLLPNENKLIFVGSKLNTISTVEIKAKYIIKSGGF